MQFEYERNGKRETFLRSRSAGSFKSVLWTPAIYLHDKSRLNPSWVNRFLLLLTISLIGFVIFMLEIEMILAILVNKMYVANAVLHKHTLDFAWLLCD